MRPLDPHGLLVNIDSSVDNHLRLACDLARLPVEIMDMDGAVALIERLAFGCVIVDYIGLAVTVKQEARIYASHLRKPHRVAPLAFFRICGGDIEIAPVVHKGGDHIESSVVGII